MAINMQRLDPLSLCTDNKVKIRNSKHQILNKSKFRNPNALNFALDLSHFNFEII